MADFIGNANTADEPSIGDQGSGLEGNPGSVISLLIKLEKKLKDMESRLGSRLGGMESRLAGVEHRLCEVGQKIDQLVPALTAFVPDSYDRLTVVFPHPDTHSNLLATFSAPPQMRNNMDRTLRETLYER